MRVILKKDWDLNVGSPLEEKKSGYFAGRKKELSFIINEISRKTKGSILISGYRGVGKTSLVYKSLWELSDRDKTLIIIMNAAQLESEKENNEKNIIHPKQIIENLIRRLYSASIDSKKNMGGLKNDIEVLYKKAVARECSILETYGKEQELINKKIIANEFRLTFNHQTVIYSIGWILAVASVVLTLDSKNIFLRLLPLLFAYPLPFLADVTFKYFRRKVKSETIRTNIKAEELYAFDNSIGNLEFDLEQIHRKFKSKEKKLLYVIDELDKLNPRNVLEVIKYFKNLFTLSDAIFLFVGGEEIYNYKNDENPKQFRPTDYTFFTTKYFLSRPLWEDLSDYFDEIIEKINSDQNVPDIEKLKRAIAFEAENDYFDLKTKIKDRIKNFDSKERPIIELEEEDTQKARFHKAISVLFNKYFLRKPSGWEENELNQRSLFKHIKEIREKNINDVITDPSDITNNAALIRDFNWFLCRLKILKHTINTSTSIIIKGIKVPIRSYIFLGNIPIEPPDNLDKPTEFENRFISEFKRLCKYVYYISNSLVPDFKANKIDFEIFWIESAKYISKLSKWGYDISPIFIPNLDIYNELINKAHQNKKDREEIETITTQITGTIEIIVKTLPVIFGNLLTEWNKDLIMNKLNDNANYFGGSAIAIKEKFTPKNPVIVTNKDLTRQILLVISETSSIKELEQIIKDNSVTNKIINFVPNPELQEFDGFNFIVTNDYEKLRSNFIKMLKYIDGFLKYKPKEENKINEKI